MLSVKSKIFKLLGLLFCFIIFENNLYNISNDTKIYVPGYYCVYNPKEPFQIDPPPFCLGRKYFRNYDRDGSALIQAQDGIWILLPKKVATKEELLISYSILDYLVICMILYLFVSLFL